jgi:transcriptional regulator with XRE-family HTH domain
MVSFGDRLRRARIAADLTQDQLGFAVGMTKQAVAAWENGRSYPGFDKWPRLRAALGISLDDLICGDADVAATARAGLNLLDGRPPDYKAPPASVGCAKDAKEFALLMRYRALEAKRQEALLEFLKLERTGGE